MAEKNILIVGVGGQGTLLAARILGNVALSMDYDVKVSEVHGMSQRGGSVVTYVRYGDTVSSPVICRGGADVIIAFEQLESARWISYLKKDGVMIINTQKINPMPVIAGNGVYPEGIIDKIDSAGIKYIQADALGMAGSAGTDKAVNIVLLGIFASVSGIDKQVFIHAIEAQVPEKFLKANLAAFDMGYSVCAGAV